jgi:hypothetical protein
MKVVLTKEIIAQITNKMNQLEGQEVDEVSLLNLTPSGELSDQDLVGVAGGIAWTIDIKRPIVAG